MKNIIYFLVLISCSSRASLVFMREMNGEKQIYLAQDDGSRPRQLTHGLKWSLYPDIDAQGQRVAWVRGGVEATEVVVASLEDGKEEVVAPLKGLQLHPDFSGDGKWLAYSRSEGRRAAIVLKDLTGEGVERVLDDSASGYFPSLSSDGSFIVFQRDPSADRREIAVWNLQKGIVETLASPGMKNMAPVLSADDRFVAFTTQTEGGWQIYLWDRIQSKGQFVTRFPGRNFAPAFRPNGDILFASDRTGHFALYEISRTQWQVGPGEGSLLLEMDGDLYAPAVSGSLQIKTDTFSDIPSPARSSFGAIRHGRDIYVIGGHQGPEHTYPENSFLDRVDIYNLDSRGWRQGAPRGSRSHGFGLASYGKYVYAFGGFAYASPDQVFTPKWRSLDIIERYDTEVGKWEAVGRLPRRRSSYVVQSLGEKAYLIGGWDATPRFDKDYDGTFQRYIDVFDFQTETVVESPFELVDPLRRALSSVVYQDEILLIGGLGQGATHFELLDNVTAFNPQKGFRELSRLPFATFAPAAGVLGDTLMVFGGMFKTSPKEYVYVNHLFEMELSETGMWGHTGRYLREPKGFAQVVSTDGALVVLGGHAYYGDVDSPVGTVDSYWKRR